jgi:hypothetical protein
MTTSGLHSASPKVVYGGAAALERVAQLRLKYCIVRWNRETPRNVRPHYWSGITQWSMGASRTRPGWRRMFR